MKFPTQNPVVVPVDFSEPSLAAVEVARTLVDAPSHLHVIHVLPPISPMDPGVVWDAWNDASRAEHAKNALRERLGADAGEYGIDVRVGDPAREIAERAKELQAGLIVLPSHGRTGAARLLIGSVAERVVRHAHCPVLVLRD